MAGFVPAIHVLLVSIRATSLAAVVTDGPMEACYLASQIERRKFLATLGGAAAAWPIAARAQQPAMPVIGFLHAVSPVGFTERLRDFRLGLKDAGYVEGENVTIEYRWAENQLDRLPALAAELAPAAARVAMFVNPANPARAELAVKEAETAGRAMGLQIRVFNVSTSSEINAAFATLGRDRPDALLVSPDPFFVGRRIQLANLAARHAIPASYSVRDQVEAGGLISYGTNVADAYRQVGIYTGRVLKGAKPADLPVVQSTKFELVINAQTALMLGLEVPATLLSRADEVIE